MSEETWLSFAEAVETVRARGGGSIGRSEALVRAAQESGEVRSQLLWVPIADDDVIVLPDDGLLDVDPIPAYVAMVQKADHPKAVFETRFRAGKCEKQISRLSGADLVDWLDRQPQNGGAPPPAVETTRRRRAAEKSDCAKRVAMAIWGPAGPPKHLANKAVWREVLDWLKAHDEPQDISERVVRRAVRNH